jgi:hypothetical protein
LNPCIFPELFNLTALHGPEQFDGLNTLQRSPPANGVVNVLSVYIALEKVKVVPDEYNVCVQVLPEAHAAVEPEYPPVVVYQV